MSQKNGCEATLPSIEDAFTDTAGETRALDRRIRDGLSMPAYESLVAHVERVVGEVESEALAPIVVRDAMYKELERMRVADPNGSLMDRIRGHASGFNPGALVADVKEAASLAPLSSDYERVVGALSGDPSIGPLVGRYAVDGPILRGLSGICAKPVWGTSDSLRQFGLAFSEHAGTLKQVSGRGAGKGLATAAGLATSVATGLIPGAVLFQGTRRKAARGVGNWAFAKYSSGTVTQSTGRVDAAYSAWRSDYVAAVGGVVERARLLALTLYGGLLLRLGEDLAAADRAVHDVDWESGRVELRLTSEAHDRFRAWASDVLGRVDRMLADGEHHAAVDAAEKALAYSLSDPARAAVSSPDARASYAVLFARRRARGMMERADRAWTESEFNVATAIYQALLDGPPVGWDREGESYDSSTAGWRLAVVASASPSAEAARTGASAYPQFVRQVKARLADGEQALEGETVCPQSDGVVQVIRAYASEVGLEIGGSSSLPRGGAEDVPRPSSITPGAAKRLAAEAPAEINGGIADWLRRRSTPTGYAAASARRAIKTGADRWAALPTRRKVTVSLSALGASSLCVLLFSLAVFATAESPAASTSGDLRSGVVAGTATVSFERSSNGETVVAVRGPSGEPSRMRPLSPSTRVESARSVVVSGRDMVEVRAEDSRWSTTYFWDYGRDALHFVSTEEATGRTNVSTDPDSPDVLGAAAHILQKRRPGRSGDRLGTLRAFEFMRAHQADFPVSRMCDVSVFRSGFYAWLNQPPSAPARLDADRRKHPRLARRVGRCLRRAPHPRGPQGRGLPRRQEAVARLMREHGIVGVSRRRGPRTTTRKVGDPKGPDLVQREFSADRPDALWVADITYVPTGSGFLYLAVVLDVFSRRIVGWAMAGHLRTELVLAALNMAVAQRKPDGVVHHSDHGCRYTSLGSGARCREAGVRPSLGNIGDCFDNAMCESFSDARGARLRAGADLQGT